MSYPYRVSVIVPIYNQEEYLDDCLECLVNQTMPASELEILLIDDGSTDKSPAMCDSFAQRYENVFVVHKTNGGLSDARNCGIEHARGKYLMYLDSDDTLAPDTCLEVANFFDKHYDEVDLVTYPSYSVRLGVAEKEPHYRYQTLTHTGIYDLADERNIYAAVTRIEVCVKNEGENNVRFSEDRTFRQEDQKYCTDVLLRKLKLGFVNKGRYNYVQRSEGLQRTFFYAYYIFEPSMAFWEEEFAKFPEGEAPHYLQALFAADLGWKLESNILIPYQYSGDEFEAAVGRIKRLLGQCDPKVVARHPALTQFQLAYFIQKLGLASDVKCLCGPRIAQLVEGDTLLYHSNGGIEIALLRTFMGEGGLRIKGFLKSPCFQFVDEPPILHALVTVDGKHRDEIVPLGPTSWSHYRTKEITNEFYGFEFGMQVEGSGSLEFCVEFNGEFISTTYLMMYRSAFRHKEPLRHEIVKDGYLYQFHRPTRFTIKRLSARDARRAHLRIERSFSAQPKTLASRLAAEALRAQKRRIWLYHDCHGVEKNNAYFQYMHDIQIDDGVERYYVVNDDLALKEHLFTKDQMKRVIRFRSSKHKMLFLAAEKIVTAYVEFNNWSAFDPIGFPLFSDLFDAEITYLQHGVLHAHTPWKYSKDRCLIDREVVSTGFEVKSLCDSYCFDDADLIKAGMPRYDYIDQTAAPKRKILLAMSWRKFLVRQKEDGQWMGVPNIFRDSEFYKQTNAFLKSPELAALLEKYDYTLDFKLHPILSELYKDCYSFDNPRINLAAESVNDADYAVFITDFSSYRFDFVYLKRAMMYFFPDKFMYDAGMCDYRETDLPIDGMFGDMGTTSEETLAILEGLLANDAKPKDEYAQQMEGFFLHYDNNQCDRIYEELSKSRKARIV